MDAGLSAERQADLDRSRARLHNEWRIASDLGTPVSEAEKMWEMVRLEMNFCCPDFVRGMSIAAHAQRWIETRNPFHIDAAVHLCSLMKIVPPPALAELVTDVARRRLRGEIQAGTPQKIFRAAAKDHALTFMTCLCASGLTVEAAASKAAAELLNPIFGASYNTSSLQKFYTRRWRSIEAKRREYWASEDGAAQLAEWLRVIPGLPDAPDDLKGARR
jgi:hypothetical protein